MRRREASLCIFRALRSWSYESYIAVLDSRWNIVLLLEPVQSVKRAEQQTRNHRAGQKSDRFFL